MRPLALALCLFAASCGRNSAPAAKASPEAKLIGTTPPEWKVERWLSSPPLTLASLRGSVALLVRWWTACPYDKHGVVRHVHPGGEYKEGDASYAKLNSVIEELLAEN